jgi:hypothetical protein
MIDCFIKFASLAAALADAQVLAHTTLDDQGARQFLADHAIGQVQVWRASQDVAGTDADGNPTVTHALLPGRFFTISGESLPSALIADAAVQVCVDRDKAGRRQTGMVVKSNISLPLLQDLRFNPVFAGSDYPWGAWKP